MSVDPFSIAEMHAPRGSKVRCGEPLDPGVRFIVAHDTCWTGVSAKAHGRWASRARRLTRAPHWYVDDRVVLELIPARASHAERANHVDYDDANRLQGYDADLAAIGVALCHGPGIDAATAYGRFVEALAYLCAEHRLDPSRAVVTAHLLAPTGQAPLQGLAAAGRSEDTLLFDVVDAFKRQAGRSDLIGAARIRKGKAETTVHLHLRAQPKLEAPALGTIPPGTPVRIERVEVGDPVAANADWCRLAGAGWCWSGGLRQLSASAPTNSRTSA